MGLPKNIIDLVRELEKYYQETVAASRESDLENEKELLNYALVELRKLHDGITQSFDNLRTKGMALLAGEITIVTFIISTTSGHGIFHGKVPVYGVVFFGLAILLLITAFLIFVNVISTVTWHQPPEEKDVANITDRFNNEPVKFLRHLRDEYLESINHCGDIINAKATRFMWGVYALLGGIFLMLMLKYGGAVIKV